MTGCCSNGASSLSCSAAAVGPAGQSSQMMAGSTEEDRWAHYSEFIFFRS
uniref:Uncharacterized protein n=1 Tax=Romanomermis culicivorax TaxID=13658 RepID=A0A915IL13_ROMCU